MKRGFLISNMIFVIDFPSDPIGIFTTIIAFTCLGAILVVPIFGSAASIVIFIAIIVRWESIVVNEMLSCLFVTLIIAAGIDSLLIEKKLYYLITGTCLILPASLISWWLWSESMIFILILAMVLALMTIMTFIRASLLGLFIKNRDR